MISKSYPELHAFFTTGLKRGTMVRKIHLIDDPELVECRVDGSTLVLKTCFLRKA